MKMYFIAEIIFQIFLILFNLTITWFYSSEVEIAFPTLFILNIFSLSVLFFLKNKGDSKSGNDHISYLSYFNNKFIPIAKDPLIWIILLSPFFVFFIAEPVSNFFSIQTFFFLVASLHAIVNILFLSSVMFHSYKQRYSIHIIIHGIVFQLLIKFSGDSFLAATYFISGYVLVSFTAIVLLIAKKGAMKQV
ncbi:MAG: hypothetical protein OXH57_12375 [Ekhidna sp.]|nr:hypothetical protein [Ekhidna sp.]